MSWSEEAARRSSRRRRILLARSLPWWRRRRRSSLHSSSRSCEANVMFNGDGPHDDINPKGYRQLYYEYLCSARGIRRGEHVWRPGRRTVARLRGASGWPASDGSRAAGCGTARARRQGQASTILSLPCWTRRAGPSTRLGSRGAHRWSVITFPLAERLTTDLG